MTYPLRKWVFKVTYPAAKNSTCPGLPHETFFESCDHPQWTYYSYNLLLRSVTALLFHKLKLLQNTPGIKTYLKTRSENSSVGIQCVETLSAFKIPIWRLFHWDMLAIWLLCCMANLERITNILKNMPSCFFYISLRFRVRVLGKSGSGFSNPKKDFAFLIKSHNGSWIHNIRTLGGFWTRFLPLCLFCSGEEHSSFPEQRPVIEPWWIIPIQLRSNLDLDFWGRFC